MASDELVQIAAKFAPKIRDAILQCYRDFLNRVSEQLVLRTFKQKGLQGLVELAESLGDDFSARVTPLLYDAWRDSGRAVLSILPAGSVLSVVVFDALPVGAISAAESFRAALVQQISETTRETIVQSVTRNMVAGNNPIKTARDFRAAIGLTRSQEQAVQNYRTMLEELDPEALQRQLRDARSDRLIERAIEDNTPLPEEKVDSLVERYRQRAIKQRAEMIARTESLRAVNMGEYESILAASNMSKINKNLRRFWVVTDDARLRKHHKQIPTMNKEGVTIYQRFSTPLGPLRYPLDPEGVPANVIGCRCRLIYRLVGSEGRLSPTAPMQSIGPSGSLTNLALPDVQSLGSLTNILY